MRLGRFVIAGVASSALLLAACASTESADTTTEQSATSAAATAAATEEAPAEEAPAEETAAAAEVTGADAVNQITDVTTLCGDKPVKVAVSDGYGSNLWRKIALADLKDEAAKCSNVVDILYADAAGDQQKQVADIKSFADQGVDILLVFPDFGPALNPAMRYATEAGSVVVPYNADPEGKVGTDYAIATPLDSVQGGRDMANYFCENLKTGNVVFLGGPAGASTATAYFKGFKEGLEKCPEVKLLEDEYVVTNWSPVDAAKAVAGLIAKYPQIDGIGSDYGVTASAAAKAFQQAGRPVPALAMVAGSNELYCLWQDAETAGEGFPFFSVEDTTQITRRAFRHGMAVAQGIENPENAVQISPERVNTNKGMNPPCNPDYPPDADMFSGLDQAELEALFSSN